MGRNIGSTIALQKTYSMGRYPQRSVPYKEKYVFFARGQISCANRRENLRDGRAPCLNKSCEFYFDDVTMKSFINIRYMAALPQKLSRNVQRSVICFPWARRRSANASQSEMCPVYGDKCFTRPAIHAWCKKFALLMVTEVLLMRRNLVAVLF